MELDPEIFKKLLETFRVELDEQSRIISDGLLALEKADPNDANINKIIESIFRSAHNIKGAANSIGIMQVGEIAHHIENMFCALQKNTASISTHIIDICLDAVDKMHLAMEAYINKTELPFDLKSLLITLKNDNEIPSENIQKKAPPRVDLPIKTEPTIHDTIRVSIENLDRVSALMEEIQINKIAIDEHYFKLSGLTQKLNQFNDVFLETQSALKLRLGVELRDSIDKLYGNSKESLKEINLTANNLQKTMRLRINELAILSNSLQEEIRMLRLVPADLLLHNLSRFVRDLAKTLKKEVNLEIKGADVKMDQMVLEGLHDPLIHLLRNAIDHGIESAETRKLLGKPEVGSITINVIDEGNQILIAVTDDGAGIDPNKIAAIAAAKNLLSKSEINNMHEKDILELIFRPGFSTKEIITSVSGRGVGLDVVKENLLDLKGSVSISTELGQSTTFCLRVPLTLSSEHGLMVSSSNQLFVIPTNAIERVLVITEDEIAEVEATQAIILDEKPIPLRTLSDILNLDNSPTTNEKLPVVIIKKGRHVLAVLVDEIVGEREIVIKPLQEPLLNIHCVAGGTLSSSGHVIIVLNTGDLIKTAFNKGKMSRVSLDNSNGNTDATPHILVVDDSITTRTLEKNILETKGYKVTVAVNGKDAWDLLQKQPFSLLVTDVSMPIMDGFTLTERVKQHDKLRDLPVIIVTSLGSDAEKKRGVEVGANAYIVKSEFESDALLAIVGQLV